jgi:hypothetical protein
MVRELEGAVQEVRMAKFILNVLKYFLHPYIAAI